MSDQDSFYIGRLRVRPNVILAPMSGITDSLFRRTIKEANPGAIGLLVSELISIEGLARRTGRSLRMIESAAVEKPLAIQLFGSEPAPMAEAARLAVGYGAATIDINCGCPVPKVVKRGGGAELMRQPLRLAALLRAVRAAVDRPVTLKIRSGWDENSCNAVEIARLAESEGAAMLAIHGRTRCQLYRGECDWDLITRVKSAVRIPVVGSGDIRTPAEALRRLKTSGVDGVMVGRGVLGNPWIFRQIAELRAGRTPHPVPAIEVLRLVMLLVERLRAELPARASLGRARGFVCRLTRGLAYGAGLREAVCRAPDIEAIRALLVARAELEKTGAVAPAA